MSIYSRPDGPNGFTNDPAINPAVAQRLDLIINGMISAYNAIDNANIANSPKIDGSKIDLSTTGFLSTTGGTMTGTLTYGFDGTWTTYRASGNARVRAYRGSDGAEIGWSYNTEWSESGSVWLGRDVTGTATVIKLESDGFSLSTAPSDAQGLVPTFTESVKLMADGMIGRNGIKGINVDPYTAGTIILVSSDAATASTTIGTTWVKFKEIQIERGGTIRVYYTADVGAGTHYFNVFRNGTAVGTQRTVTGLSNWEEDIAGWSPNDLVQIWARTASSSYTATVSNFRIKVANPLQNWVTFTL